MAGVDAPRSDRFASAIERAIGDEVRKIADEEAAAAAARVQERVRGEIDRIVLSVAGFYSVERMRDELIITVKR